MPGMLIAKWSKNNERRRKYALWLITLGQQHVLSSLAAHPYRIIIALLVGQIAASFDEGPRTLWQA